MKKSICLVAFSLFALTCSSDKNPLKVEKETNFELTTVEKKVVASNNSFGLNLFKKVFEEDPQSNHFISPLSVSMALGMTLNGAEGETFEDIRQTLNWQDLDTTQINEAYHRLINVLLDLDDQVILELANSIWCRNGFDVRPAFLELNRLYFDAEVAELNFDDPSAVDIINTWISEKTNEKITDMLDGIDPLVVMYLINAIYFKGMWTYQFNPEHTDPDLFYAPGGPVEIPMMTQVANHGYFETADLQCLDMAYGNGDFSMTLILPKAPKTVTDIMANLSDDSWVLWLNGLRQDSIMVYMPKFKLEYKILLNNPLTILGMGIAFTDRANFQRISQTAGLFISRVLHQSFIEINEVGTEAAAATIVEISLTSAGGPAEPVTVRLDHPFIFFIRENNSQSILFCGILNQPQ